MFFLLAKNIQPGIINSNMHDHHHDHGTLMQNVAAEYADIFENSDQGIYVFLDDENKVCNKKFATMLGYESPEAWAKVEESFPMAFVATESHKTLIGAYQDAMDKVEGSVNSITWKKKDGSTMNSNVILVPIVYENHLLALHFVTSSS